MPIRGARVRRSNWFHEIVAMLEVRKFKSGAPGMPVCPGFYFYSRARYTVQICPNNRLRITRPSGRTNEHQVPRSEDAEQILDALESNILFGEE